MKLFFVPKDLRKADPRGDKVSQNHGPQHSLENQDRRQWRVTSAPATPPTFVLRESDL